MIIRIGYSGSRDGMTTPKTADPHPGSGTWTTIGYAVQLGRPARVFTPGGYQRAGSGFCLGVRP